MENATPLDEAIRTAVADWIANNGGGFTLAFVLALDFIDANGDGRIAVIEMENQPTHRSMGLATWLDSWYRDDAQTMFAQMVSGEEL